MRELKQLIAGLIRKQRPFEDVSRGLDQFLARNPGEASRVAQLLRNARKAGLPHPQFVALNGQLAAFVNAATDPGATRFDAGVEAAPANDADATDMAADGADVSTVPDDDATELPGGAAHDPDATSMAVGDVSVSAHGADAGSRSGSTTVAAARSVMDAGEVFGPVSADITEPGAAGRSEATMMSEHGFDIVTREAMDAADRARARTGASWPTAPGSAGPVAGVDREFHEGDLLRGRFELISKLGEGGMGAVWKGLDRLKEEARDRNPYVAIKLLQGDFKAHPEAFIALQRETAKQQRLAHPNIATVYDFDRDDATGTVFMTMEVLEGQPLDAFIRKLPADGLGEEEAMPLIEQLCNGLAYAHQASLVHSDLKPGNCFFTKDGGIKLLDFGIARASKTKSDAEGDTTLFDPGQLGALTPTYATIEMFEGEDPDPRDDIYALAIMSYQLLTGKHPYGKKSALKAKELGLVADPVAKLSKAQNRGLARALAFHREDRTESVEAFLDSITRRKSRAGLWAAGVAAVLTLAVAGAWTPAANYLASLEREEVIAVMGGGGLDAIQRGLNQARALGDEQFIGVLEDERAINTVADFIAASDANVQPALGLLSSYPPEWQRAVKDVEKARNAIISHYEQRIEAVFAPQEARYDFPSALRLVGTLDRHYPDSAQVFQLRGTLEDIKVETLADMAERFKAVLAAGALVPDAQAEDITDVLGVVKAIEPGNRLLQDRNLPFRFAEETQRAIEQDGDYARASALLEASAAYAPDDPKLKGLRYDLDRILTRIENEKRIAELETRLLAAEGDLDGLDDYQGVRDQLVTLADLSPGSDVLVRLQGRLRTAFGTALESLGAAGEWQRSEELLFAFARLLSVNELTGHRAALSAAQAQAGFSPDLAARAAAVRTRLDAVSTLLADPEFTTDWETRLKVPYKELIALQPPGGSAVNQARNDTARLLLGAAREAREQENFNQAREFVSKGLAFHPELADFGAETAAIDAAERAFLARRAEEERLARIGSSKSEFAEAAQANDVQAANRILEELRGLGLDAADPFLTTEAPQRLSRSYQRLATRAAQNDDFLSAAELARQGLALNPTLTGLAAALAEYEVQVKAREREIRLAALFNSLDPIDVTGTRQALAALESDYPDRHAAMVSKLSGARADQLRRYARSRNVDVAALAARSGEFTRLFPTRGAELATELADAVEPRLRSLDVTTPTRLGNAGKALKGFARLAPERHRALRSELAGKALARIRDLERTDKAAAAGLARAARTAFPDDAEIGALTIVVPLREITAGLAQLERGQLEAAAGNLAAAKKKDATHPDVASFEAALGERRARADEAYRQHVALTRDPLGYKRRNEIRDLYRQATGLCSDCRYRERQPPKAIAGLCHPGLAGFGSKRAGQCWDRIGRDKGPVMVVVPGGGNSPSAFAIGKYEVSTRDFNAFCKATGECKVVLGSKSRLPATGIGASLAEAYARWLSESASKTLNQKVTYRLPTAAEWEYAASANGAQPQKKFNCRVTSGGNVIAGHDLVDARSGQQNGWGLTNYVGNAQELVRSGSGFAVRGGDFEVPLTRCDVSVSEPHSGAPDSTTGFRLVRELG